MTDRKMVNDSVDIEQYEAENLIQAVNRAWKEIPEIYRETAKLGGNYISYLREENDDEFNKRIEAERAAAEAERAAAEVRARQLAAKVSTHLVSELHHALNLGLNEVNKNWENMKIGDNMKLGGSVPMLDGRIASVHIVVTVREAVKSLD